MRPNSVAIAAIAAVMLAPSIASADRGALTVDAGPAVTLTRPPPAVGDGPSVNGSAAGGFVGVRYGVRNELELSATGFYDAPVDYYHRGARVTADGATFSGVLRQRTTQWGALVGVRYVRGLVFRWHVGAELGWAHQRFEDLDLVNVSDPSNQHSYGLGLRDRATNALVFSPLAGLEWQVTDRISVTALPRLEFLLGGVGRVAFQFPITIGYSWFVF
jgi:hypothetical protein